MKQFKSIQDHLGIVAACVCIIHCLLVPFFLILGTFAFNGTFFVLALAITGHAIYHAYKEHCKHIVLFFGIAGILLLGGDLILDTIGVHNHEPVNFSSLEIDHSNHDHTVAETEIHYMSIVGGILLIMFHISNIFSHKKSACCS